MIVTIDGPAGAGKTTSARLLAQRLGFDLLDTGAMYRAVALAGLRADVDFASEIQLARLLDTVRLEMPVGRVLLNGEDVTLAIRSPEATALSSPVAASRVVRERLVQWQRDIAKGRNLVTEGRDQGSVVFADAVCKFFLTADPIARAERRVLEMRGRGEAADVEDILKAQEARDKRDAGRDIAPMKPAADAVLLDTTRLTLDEVVQRMEQEVRRRMPPTP